MPFQLEAGRARSRSLTRPSESCAPGEMATSEEQMWLFNMEGMRGMTTLTFLLLPTVLPGPPWTLSHQMSEGKGEPRGYRTKR